ncbi:Solute carrier family 12 member 9 isoform X1 [Oopsacas minuta]|uniref:Solute carrier family 12 member 9 n=1 Tax=Oopsacas minuta TaxID=111878 RepID=A0AAV7K7W5_9METZ|nr:Solute carrier family 12 member 9 isoform X1 [Oopsacas minuta]
MNHDNILHNPDLESQPLVEAPRAHTVGHPNYSYYRGKSEDGYEGSLITSTVLAPEITPDGLYKMDQESERNFCCKGIVWAYRKVFKSGPTKLSTFTGVIVPCTLSMFSVILFLRIGMVVGQAGLLQTVGMLMLAYLVTALTVLSLSAISTNEVIKAGGAYYMISRALGPELGGAIGLLFYIANVFGCALYVIGLKEVLINNFGASGTFADSLTYTLPSSYLWDYLYGTLTLGIGLIVCVVGAGMFAKTTLLIFIIVMVSLLAVIISFWHPPRDYNIQVTLPNGPIENHTLFFFGFSNEIMWQNFLSHYTTDITTGTIQTFATIFAILFNGCTGIMAGANMSGDLKNPSKSIPQGTLQAVGFTFLVYLIVAFLTAYTCHRTMLHYDYAYMVHINYLPPLVVVGIIVVTMSASLSNFIGSTRILWAVAKDDIFGILLKPFSWATKGGNPIPAVFLSWFIAQLVLFAGKLNTIAPLVSILFLLSYANVNLSCLALEWASAPNFRPTFKYFHWTTALLGFLACVIMMFVVNPLYAGIAIVLYLTLIVIIHYRKTPTSWGDITQALIFHQVRKYLLMLDIRKDHVKYWRPQLLLLVSNPRASVQQIQFMNQMKKSGLFILGHVLKGSMEDDVLVGNYNTTYQAWLKLVDLAKVKAFVEVTISPSMSHAIATLIQVSGLGGMKPNTIVFGFYDDQPQHDALYSLIKKEKLDKDPKLSYLMDTFLPMKDEVELYKDFTEIEYVQLINDALRLGKNVCITRYFSKMEKISRSLFQSAFYIDIWLVSPESIVQDVLIQGDLDDTQLIMLQFACIMQMVPGWKNAKLRVFTCSQSHDQGIIRLKVLKSAIEELRIHARVEVVLTTTPLGSIDTTTAENDTHTSPEYLSAHPYKWLNRTIRDRLFNTKVVFCYLSKPPADVESYSEYLQNLATMTDEFPPCILMYGETQVIHAPQ